MSILLCDRCEESIAIEAFFGFENLDVTVTEGQTKYVLTGNRTAVISDEASANVVISFPEGGKPTVTLKSGLVYGNSYALQIGRDGDYYDVNVVVARKHDVNTKLGENRSKRRAIFSYLVFIMLVIRVAVHTR